MFEPLDLGLNIKQLKTSFRILGNLEKFQYQENLDTESRHSPVSKNYTKLDKMVLSNTDCQIFFPKL